MANLPDDEMDHLLSRGGLGGAHKERLLRGVLGRVAVPASSRRRPRWLWQTVAGLSLATGVAAFALWGRPSGETGSALRAKGAPSLAPVVGLSCLGGSLGACPAGSRIAFWLEGGPDKQAGFITAYADSPAGGGRVWYLTNEAAGAAPSSPVESPRVVPKAALIGQEQPPGHYRVHVVFTRHPVGRADLSRLTTAEVVTRASFDLVVSP